MANLYGYFTFYRDKSRFIYIFVGFILVGALAFGLLDDLGRSVFIIFLCLTFMVVFFYEIYLVSLPIVEIINDSMIIRQIYDPIVKWRFVYARHIIGFVSIMLMQVKLDKKGAPNLLLIQYRDGTKVKKCYLTRRDVRDFGSVVKLISDKLPDLTINYVNKV